MARVKRGVTKHARHKKVLSAAKGSRGRQKNTFRAAMQRVEKNMQYAYRDRRNKKREFRKLWIIRINAACRELGMKYSEFIEKLNKNNLQIDRKVLASLAYENPGAFKAIVEKIKN
tara:strand:+ start:215 stop:562 length:348 start_codon:yes stop_codon:yes gene_type:complete